ncbi:MAG: transposase [Gelidibacter sp.]
MADKFHNKYRIPSARLQTWDYRWEGAYFITICTKDRKHYFGEVVNNKMNLSNVGVLADVFWHEIKNHSKNMTLGEFVVMPNHIHGIIIINPDLGHDLGGDLGHDPEVKTRHALSLRDVDADVHAYTNENPQKSIGENRFRNPGKNSVSSLIGGYKSAVTKHANRLNLDFGWQTRFYDHIIRDERSFNTISNYIINNPSKWGEDKFRS